MIKVFTLNKNGKIELTKEELEQLLNESYWDGLSKSSWTYTSPSIAPLNYDKITVTAATNDTKTFLGE